MKRWPAIVLLLMGMAAPLRAASAAIIHNQPLNSGRISPMLFGNFIELLDDLVPGMWAEMLNDRSFEGTGKLSDWCYYDGAPDCCDRQWDTNDSWKIDTVDHFSGARCAVIAATSRRIGSLTQSGLATKKGMVYEFSGHLRSDDPSLKVTVVLKTPLPGGDWMTLASADLPALSPIWQKRSVRLSSNGDTDHAVFELRVRGRGRVWADKVSLMPADNIMGWRRDVIDAIRDARPGVVRFGGSVCDPGGYRWKNGIGDRDRRDSFPNKVWGRLDPNDVGVDEFCQFCDVTGVAPLMCVSFSGGPQDAADLVQYCNGDIHTQWGARRAAHGHPTPYNVKYWQVGNEISGDDPNYLAQLPQFVVQMKQADHGIEVLSSFPSQKLFDKLGKVLSFVAPHQYTPDLAACDRDLENLTRMIGQTPGCNQIQIAVTEWNTSGGDWGLGRGQFLTLDNALRNAHYLHVLMHHCDKVKIACRSNMANSFNSGIIGTSPGGLLKRPSYYVMQLYARHALPVPLKVDEGRGGPDAFACMSEDGQKLAVFLINSRTEPVDWLWKLDGFNGKIAKLHAETVRDIADTRQLDVMNHWNASGRVKTVDLLAGPDRITLPALSATAVECEIR